MKCHVMGLVSRFSLVVGRMPDVLIKEWERWDQQHKSENDHPSMLKMIVIQPSTKKIKIAVESDVKSGSN